MPARRHPAPPRAIKDAALGSRLKDKSEELNAAKGLGEAGRWRAPGLASRGRRRGRGRGLYSLGETDAGPPSVGVSRQFCVSGKLRSSLSAASRGRAKETEPLIETNNHPSRNLGLIIHASAPEERPLDFTFPLIDFAFDFAHFAP